MAEIKYEIIKKIGTLSKSASGWAKEVNLISWNDRDAKYDIRDWSAGNATMGKGITPIQGRVAGVERIAKFYGTVIDLRI